AGRNHAGLVDLGTWDRVYLVGILQVRLADTLPDRGVSAPLRRRRRYEGRHRKRQRQGEKILAQVPHGRSPVHLDPYWIAEQAIRNGPYQGRRPCPIGPWSNIREARFWVIPAATRKGDGVERHRVIARGRIPPALGRAPKPRWDSPRRSRSGSH